MIGINIQAIAEKLNLQVLKLFPRRFDEFVIWKHFKDKKNLIGIEIGTEEALHARWLIKQESVSFMSLIDEYKEFNDVGTYGVDLIRAERRARKRLERYEGKWEIIKENSDVAHKHFKKESIDFIYVDGGHSYEQTKKEIENYYPLLKKGGVIGGRDFYDGDVRYREKPNGVIPAVMEFVKRKGLRLYVNHYDWWVVK